MRIPEHNMKILTSSCSLLQDSLVCECYGPRCRQVPVKIDRIQIMSTVCAAAHQREGRPPFALPIGFQAWTIWIFPIRGAGMVRAQGLTVVCQPRGETGILVAKLGPDATTNYQHDRIRQCNKTGTARKSVLAATLLIVLI